jgi:hypothetical protein
MITYCPFIVFEGNSGVGKSTYSSRVASLLGREPVIGEYFNYLGVSPRFNLPDDPPKDVATVLRTNFMWPAVDTIRTEDLQKQSTMALVDTSPLSVLGYECAKARLSLPHALEDLARRYATEYDNGTVTQPCGWIFLYGDSAVLTDRLKAKGGTRPLLERRDSMEYLNLFRRYFMRNYLNEAEYIAQDISAPDLVDNICRFIRVCAHFETTGLRRFVEDILAGKSFYRDLVNLGSDCIL